jgi:hypothetical protein
MSGRRKGYSLTLQIAAISAGLQIPLTAQEVQTVSALYPCEGSMLSRLCFSGIEELL